MGSLKISMACWQVASESVTRRKAQAARRFGVTTCAGGGPFEVAVTMGRLDAYLDLCADIGFTRIEAGEGFTDSGIDPGAVMAAAEERGLEVQFEMGKKHGGTFSGDVVQDLIDQGRRWLDVGAKQLVVEARESAMGVGVFDDEGQRSLNSSKRSIPTTATWGCSRGSDDWGFSPRSMILLSSTRPGSPSTLDARDVPVHEGGAEWTRRDMMRSSSVPVRMASRQL